MDTPLDAISADIAMKVAEKLAPIIRASVTPREDGWLDSKEAAAYLGISPTALHKLTSACVIEKSQAAQGGPCFFRRSHLDAYRERFLVPASPPC